MQQSDQLLITSLRDFLPLPPHIHTLNDIRGDQLFSISISFLQAMERDVKEIKQIQKQKFRSTTKLNQKLDKECQIELELNDLLNPTVNFVRKTLLVFLSKLGAVEGQHENVGLGKHAQEDVQKRRRKRLMTDWLQDQWIHPDLTQPSRPAYCAYLFPLAINRKTIKTNLISYLQCNQHIKANSLSILTTSINHNIMRQRESERNAGITRKKVEENAGIQAGRLIASNFDDWNMAEQRLNKIRRKLQKDKQTAQAAKKAQHQEQKHRQLHHQQNPQPQHSPPQSVFQTQVSVKIEQKQKQKQTTLQLATTITAVTQQSMEVEAIELIQNPLERLQKEAEIKRGQYEVVIQGLLGELNQRREEVQVVALRRERVEGEIQRDEEKLVELKAKTDNLRKQVQKRQLVLQAVQSPTSIQQQITKFQSDITHIQQQLGEQVQTTTTTIQSIRQQSERKIQALQDLRIKLNRIESQYKEICEQIQDKMERKARIKIAKSGIGRNYYSKRISEIDRRWRESQREVVKIKRELDIMKEKTNSMTNAGDYMQREIERLILADKSTKTEQQTKALREIFLKCQSCYKTTLQTLNKINEIKEQTRQYEIKVHTLTSQNYRQGIEKVNNALVELKKQIQEMAKKQIGK